MSFFVELCTCHQLRTSLTQLGFGTVAPGVWVAPGHLVEQTRVALARRESFDWANPSAEGFMAILPLSQEGHLALLNGRFEVGDPDPAHLVGQHEEAAAVYFAAIYAPGALAGGVGLAFDQVSTPLRREAR